MDVGTLASVLLTCCLDVGCEYLNLEDSEERQCNME